jgi:uncharacterized membrane protein
MSNGAFLTLGSIEAVRPVFMIVMGLFMLLFVWRLARVSDVWTSRLLMAGALMLAFGYCFMLPLLEAGVLEHYSPARLHYHGSADTALGWHVTKLTVMNLGWLVMGLGFAMHARILVSTSPRRSREIQLPSPNEFVA